MLPLVIGRRELETLADLVSRAAAAPTDYVTMKRMVTASRAGVAVQELNRGLTVDIPTAYTVTLTFEEHRPGVLCRHASVGVRTRPGYGPSVEASQKLLGLLGFLGDIKRPGSMAMYLEILDDGTVCPNFIEPLDGDMTKLKGQMP